MNVLRRLTPRASSTTRLFVAAALWSAIGSGLLVAGVRWLVAARATAWLASIPVAVAAGWAKGRFVLAPRAHRNSMRIAAAREPRCVGGVFSWSSWGLAAGMMATGILLRHSRLPRPWLGVLYTAVGTALLSASLASWRDARRTTRTIPDPDRAP